MTDQEPKTTASAKFIQLTAGLPYGQGLVVFALDAEGSVWRMVEGRDEEWQRLPKKRAGGPGRPASR